MSQPETRVKREKSAAQAQGSTPTLAVNGTTASNQRPIRPRAVAPAPAATPVVASVAASTKPVYNQVQFNYSEIDGVTIPKIFRSIHSDQVAYVVVRMVELKLLWRFPNNYPDELKKRPPLRSSYMTEEEGALINEINEMHCLNEYGKHDYSKRDNMLVKFDEFMDFYDAVRRCYPDIAANRCVGISLDELNQMKGGFLQISNVVCPFVYRKEIKFVPYTYLRSCGMDIGLESTDGFGYYPSPKECAFFNSVSPRLGIKVQMGMLSRLMSLDMLEKLTDCQVRELNILSPFASTQFNPSAGEIRLCGLGLRQQQFQQPQAVFNVMAVNRPTMISVAPLVSGPGGTFTTANGIPVLSGAHLLQAAAPMTAAQVPVVSTVTTAAAVANANNAANGRPRPQAAVQGQLQQQQQTQAQRNAATAGPGARMTSAQQQQPASGPSDPKRRRTAGEQQQQQQQQQPQTVIQKQLVKDSHAGACSLLKVQGDITNGRPITLCIIRPYIPLLPDNALQGDYVVLDHVRRTLFPNWPAERLLTVLRCVVPANKIYRIAEGLVTLFEEAFSFRLAGRDNALLHAETFLKNLPFLQIRYHETTGGVAGTPHPAISGATSVQQPQQQQLQQQQQQTARIALPPLAASSAPIHVLASIGQLQQQQQQQQQQQLLLQQQHQQRRQLLSQQAPVDVIQIDD